MAKGRSDAAERLGAINDRWVGVLDDLAEMLPAIPELGEPRAHMVAEAYRLRALGPRIVKPGAGRDIATSDLVAVESALDRAEALLLLLRLAVLESGAEAPMRDEIDLVTALQAHSKDELLRMLEWFDVGALARAAAAPESADLAVEFIALMGGTVAGLKEKILAILKALLLLIFVILWYLKVVEWKNIVKLALLFVRIDRWAEDETAPAPKDEGPWAPVLPGTGPGHYHIRHCENVRIPADELSMYEIWIAAALARPAPVVEVRREKNGPVVERVGPGERKVVVTEGPELWVHLKSEPHRAAVVGVRKM